MTATSAGVEDNETKPEPERSQGHGELSVTGDTAPSMYYDKAFTGVIGHVPTARGVEVRYLLKDPVGRVVAAPVM